MPLSLTLAVLLALGSAAGIHLSLQVSRLVLLLAVATGAAGGLACWRRAPGPAIALLAVAVAGVAAWRASAVAYDAEQPPLARWFAARVAAIPGGADRARDSPVRLRGRLAADAAPTELGAQLLIDVHEVEQEGAWRSLPGGVSVSVSGDLLGDLGEWRAGRTIVAPVTLRTPTEYRNHGLVDRGRALARRGAALVGSIKSGALVEVERRGRWWDEWAAALRALVRETMRRRVTPLAATSAAIGTAILIGDRASLAPDVERRLQEAGTYHVIAISGGNIALLAAGVLALLWCVGVRFAPAAGLTAAVLVAHGWVVGGGASVVRATVVACTYLALRLIDQRTAPVHALALAAAAMLAVDPLEVAGAGFWLTFGATSALLLAATRGPRLDAGRWWTPVVAITLASAAVEALLMPIGAYVFERVTLAGLVLNLAAVPAMALVQAAASACVIAEAAGATVLGNAFAWGTHLGARALLDSSGLVALAPWATWRVPPPGLVMLLVYYALLASCWWASAPPMDSRGRQGVRRASAGLAVAAWCWIATAPDTLAGPQGRGLLRVSALDVGQGDALLVGAPDGRTLMVDAGGVAGVFDIGDRVVGPSLRARGLRRLDYVVVTHGDQDHLGGAATLVREFGPREVWAGVPVTAHPPLDRLRAAAAASRTPWRWLQRGDRLELGSLEVRAHHPPAPEWERQRVRNDDSVVLELRYGSVSVWLTGDVTRAVEAELMAAADPARLNVLKAAHHGSLTSSGAEWLRRLSPVAVLVSAGRGNLFGHPAPAVLRRYDAVGAEVFRTDRDGQIELVTNGTFIEIRTFTGRRWRLR